VHHHVSSIFINNGEKEFISFGRKYGIQFILIGGYDARSKRFRGHTWGLLSEVIALENRKIVLIGKE
jgi:hypothetical protein